MIEQYQSEHEFIIYDSELLSSFSADVFNPEYWQNQQRMTGSAQGRGTTWFIQLEQIQAALRHYRRGGLFGKLVKDQYWFAGWEKSRSVAEFRLLNHLRNAGVNVPRPVAAKVVRKGLFYQADLLSERIANARDLVAVLKHQALSRDMYQRIGQEIAKMHPARVTHTDLNIHNILLDENDRVWIIDFDKCYVDESSGWKENNLSRLLRSFQKELKKYGICWQPIDFYCVKEGYCRFK